MRMEKDMKTGRNDPCPCGSGKKFKKCCLTAKVTAPEDLAYRRFSEVYNSMFDRLVQHAERVFGDKAIRAALQEYLLWPDDDEAKPEAEHAERHMPLFWPWFVFNWEYDLADDEVELHGPPDRTVAELYTEERGRRLDPYERLLIEAVNRKPASFYEVLEVEPGRQILLQDVLTGNRVMVQERTASQNVKPSDIVFGRVVVVDGIGMILGLSQFVIPPGHKPTIIELRGKIRGEAQTISEEMLTDWEIEIREIFLSIDRAMFSPPKLCNTDGDPLEFHKLIFDIDSPDEAFEKLVSLCVTSKASEIREEAEKDEEGHILRAEITWNRKGHKVGPGLPNTILGNIVIDGRRLKAEVNSAQRARAIRRKIETGLGAGARFRMDEIGNLDKMMADEKLMGRASERSAGDDALMHEPEIRRHMADMIRKHWESWVDMEIPALGGKTPRAAVLTRDGIEAVEALLAQAERTGETDPDLGEMNREGTRLVRELLGLTRPSSGK